MLLVFAVLMLVRQEPPYTTLLVSQSSNAVVPAAERKRAKAQELWQLAEDTAVVAPQSCAAKPNAAAFTGILLQQHRHTADLPHGPSAMEPCSTGELSQALLAAQQLLKGMHPSHVPGLGFTRVVRPDICMQIVLMV